MSIAIFIDGGYLDKTLQDFNMPRIDYQKLSELMAGKIHILRTYYYHCLPYQSNPATEEESIRFARTQKFFDKLVRLQSFDVKLGKLEKRGYDKNNNPILIQKRVDTLLAIDLVLLSVKLKITHASIFAGDSDFLPAINIAKNEGVIVNLFHGSSIHNDLWNICDNRTKITESAIKNILRY